MKYLSLFTGIGGFEKGIEQAYELLKLGVEPKNSADTAGATSQHSERPLCIGFSEVDKYATKIYQHHYPEHTNYGDITKINSDHLPEFELLVGGFPCQSFSIAGKRGGFSDTRGTMFFEIARILKQKQPRLLLLENVKGLLSHAEGRTFRIIISTLDELGYDVQWQVLNSKDFGVPQNRERVYIVGHLRGTRRPEVFPIRSGDGKTNSPKWKEDQPFMLAEHRTELGKQTRREIRKLEGRDSTLRGKNHKEYRPNFNGLANCITTGKESIEKWVVEMPIVRRLTPTECARLQGFPDDWHKIDGISDTQAYKCYGNAVTVNVVQAIVKKLFYTT